MIKHILSRLFRNNTILSLLANVSVTFFGMTAFVLLAHSLAQQDLGKYLVYVAAFTMIEMIRSGLSRIAIIRFLSGAPEQERLQLIGANWSISIGLTLLIVAATLIVRFAFAEALARSAYHLFVYWYPILALVNLPYNNALTFLQANEKFNRIMWLRIGESGSFVLFLLANLFLKTGIETIIQVQIVITAGVSLFCSSRGWDEVMHLRRTTVAAVSKLLHFGKYSLGTLIGSNLLKSTDVFVIGANVLLGPEAVALYGVPLKLIELLEVPLRSLVATAFPTMSRAARQQDRRLVEKKFHQYVGFATLLFLVVVFFAFFAADLMILVFAGHRYASAGVLFRIFCIYGLLLPIDRFSGVTLDSLNLPGLNFFKVTIMAAVNLVGDLIAVFYFQSLIGVAVTTVVMTLIGTIWGIVFLKRHIDINLPRFFSEGGRLYLSLFHDLFNPRGKYGTSLS